MILDPIESSAANTGLPGSTNRISRRTLLRSGAAAGGGLILSLSLPFAGGEAEAAAGDFTPNAFIRIGNEGRIVLTMPYVEMAQGTYTPIPMLIAEELEVDLKQVRLEHAPANEKLYANPLLRVQATGNSNAIRGAWQPLRQAGATARSNVLAVARPYLGSVDKVTRIVRLGVSVASSGDVRDQPKVADAASELLQDVFGKDKSPCRLVYGVANLPLGTPVELEIIFEVAG